MKTNVYELVTERIIEQLNAGIIPWRRPWSAAKVSAETAAVNYVTRKGYSILNQWLLGEPGEYLSFKQVQSLGGQVNKGAKSRMVVFYTQVPYVEKKDDGTEVLKSYPVLKYYNVFHLRDTNLPSKFVPGEVIEMPALEDAAEEIIRGYLSREATLKFINDKPSNKAFYQPTTDTVVVPMPSQFKELSEYYSTAFHEFTHSTLKASRCDREAENKNAYFGNGDYSREELVAEMGSAMILSHLGIEVEKTFKNSVAYLQSWVRALKGDPKMIVWAASRAEKAARYILNEQGAE